MDGHAMSFGADAGPQVYHAFVVVFQDEQGRTFGSFGPTRQPFPSYAVGNQLDVNGADRTITAVRHSVHPKAPPEDWVLQTIVIVR